jgi:hypothetical protein
MTQRAGYAHMKLAGALLADAPLPLSDPFFPNPHMGVKIQIRVTVHIGSASSHRQCFGTIDVDCHKRQTRSPSSRVGSLKKEVKRNDTPPTW